MAKEEQPIEDSKAQVESAIENEMDGIGAGDIPEEVKNEEVTESEEE